jgi:hypothetical protein
MTTAPHPTKLNPGSAKAVKAGCTCPVMDNTGGATLGREFWITVGCPLHGRKDEAQLRDGT